VTASRRFEKLHRRLLKLPQFLHVQLSLIEDPSTVMCESASVSMKRSRGQQTKQPKREDVRPAQFTHPTLASREKKWLCPGDALFKACSEHSYKGLRVERAATFGTDVHTQFKGEPKACTQWCDECVQCKPPACCNESL
jgi:hypothetical protein